MKFDEKDQDYYAAIGALSGLDAASQIEYAKHAKLGRYVLGKFKSGNEIAIDRIVIRADEVDNLMEAPL